MFCCEVQEGVSFKDGLIGKVNLCIPIEMEEKKEDNLGGDVLQEGPSNATFDEVSNGDERTNLVDEAMRLEEVHDERTNFGIPTAEENENGALTIESTQVVSMPGTLEVRERLATQLRNELIRRDEENALYDRVDIGNGYFQVDLEYLSMEEDSYFAESESSTLSTETGSSVDTYRGSVSCTYINEEETEEVLEGVMCNHNSNMRIKEELQEVNMSEENIFNGDKVVPGNYATTTGGNVRHKLIPGLSSCTTCDTLGLYLDQCVTCGKVNETLDDKPKEEELYDKAKSLGRCHLCNRIGIFANKCNCGGFNIKNIVKLDSIIGMGCKCSMCNKVGIFGDKCLCGHLFRIELNMDEVLATATS